VQSTDPNKAASKLSPFVIDKALKCSIGTVKTVRCLQQGDILIEVSSATQSSAVTKLNNLAGCPVTASPHRTLNTCKGIIRCKPLVDCEKQEVLAEMKSQGVVNIENISVKDSSGGRSSNTFVVTFRLPTLPKHVIVGYMRVPVDLYILNPLRCFKCQKFGHGSKACKGTETCARCGQTGHNGDCSNEVKCPNCSGAHTAFSKECPKWILERKIQGIKAERGISYFEARKIVTAESEGRSSLGSHTAAAVVGSKSVPTRPSTCSAAVQTDLTWPDRQKQPSLIRPSAATGTNQSSQMASPSRTERSSKSKQSLSPRATTSGFSQPTGKAPCNDKAKKLRLHRPPKSDTDTAIRTKKQI